LESDAPGSRETVGVADEEAGAEEESEDAAGDEAAASGCPTGNVRSKTAARRNHPAGLSSRLRRGSKADLLVDGTSDSMGS
jgi:hypothetical protein